MIHKAAINKLHSFANKLLNSSLFITLCNWPVKLSLYLRVAKKTQDLKTGPNHRTWETEEPENPIEYLQFLQIWFHQILFKMVS